MKVLARCASPPRRPVAKRAARRGLRSGAAVSMLLATFVASGACSRGLPDSDPVSPVPGSSFRDGSIVDGSTDGGGTPGPDVAPPSPDLAIDTPPPPPPDASDDPMPPPPPDVESDMGGSDNQSLETVLVPAAGTLVAFSTKLDVGELYLLKARGMVDLGGTGLDAEYTFAATGGTGTDVVSGNDVGVDMGQKELILPGIGRMPPVVSATRKKWFGAFRADHVYYMVVTGNGQALPLKLIRPAGAPPGTGEIVVTLYRLTPAATKAIGAPLEQPPFVIPFTKTTESNAFKPVAGAVYLLQAQGETQVGTGVADNGDAEFDDYRADGTGANEGETTFDYGICVDEACSAKRARKWGPFRKDHNYFMLYAGNGAAIRFSYCDSNYADNMGGLPVKIYATP